MKSIISETNENFELVYLHQNINDHEKIECPICTREIKPYWEPRYSGIRATCDVCEINWAES